MKTKKLIYGLKRVRPGGPEAEDEEDGDESETEMKRTDDSIEPVFYHSLPRLLVQELVRAFCLVGILDLTMDCGDRALAAIDSGVLYTGIALTQTHMELVKVRILIQLYHSMLKEGSRVYQEKMAALVKEHKKKANKEKKEKKAKAAKESEDSKPKKSTKKSRSSSSSSSS